MYAHSHKWHLRQDEPLTADMIARLENPTRQKIFEPANWLAQAGPLAGKTLADLACGTGFFTPALLEAVGPRGKVYGIDIDKRMIEHIQTRFASNPAFRPTLSAPDHIPLPDACLDAAVLISAFHDLEGDSTLREIRRLLKPGAVLLVADWKKIRQETGPAYDVRIREPDAKARLFSLGFSCSLFEVSDSAWGIRALKPA